MKIVYIIGTQHPYQLGTDFGLPEKKAEEFQEMLHKNIEGLGIVGIGEELPPTVVGPERNKASIAHKICQQRGLPHKYCDADKETKDSLGITDDLDPKRERFWLEQMSTFFAAFPILFICGAMHWRRFSALLEESGFETKLICGNWPHRFRGRQDHNAAEK